MVALAAASAARGAHGTGSIRPASEKTTTFLPKGRVRPAATRQPSGYPPKTARRPRLDLAVGQAEDDLVRATSGPGQGADLGRGATLETHREEPNGVA